MIETDTDLVGKTLSFLLRCRADDGGYGASPDPAYPGRSDTAASDLAAPVYAAVLARTFGEQLPHADDTVEFIQSRQRSDGSFGNRAGTFDPNSDLALLYNMTQAVVGLRALGASPLRPPALVMDRFLEQGSFRALPWYTTSFFPLFYAVLGVTFPEAHRQAISNHMIAHQAEDGYLGDHVASTFHMAHFYRLVGETTPGADRMVERVLRDQAPDGGWAIKHPDWDVHACFDGVFILRQLGGSSEPCRQAIQRAADWALRCRNPDGGFGHFPGEPSDMDAVYFQIGTLWQAGRIPGSERVVPEGHLLGWGHAMEAPHPATILK